MDSVSNESQEVISCQVLPLIVEYCSVCNFPLEYCRYNKNYSACKTSLQKNNKEMFLKLYGEEDIINLSTSMSKAKVNESQENEQIVQTGSTKKVTFEKEPPNVIKIKVSKRSFKKLVTSISGLTKYDISLKKAAKQFSGKFCCGSSVDGDEVIIQGDVKSVIIDYIVESWPQIPRIKIKIVSS